MRPKFTARYGPVSYDTCLMPFDHTSYYDAELGGPVLRRLTAFTDYLPHDCLADMKDDAMAWEREYARPDGSRVVNIDPGMLCLERLVLATGKNFTHRVYLRDGIWADLTLIYQNGDWRSLDWTFADYSSEEMLVHLRTLRKAYKETTQR